LAASADSFDVEVKSLCSRRRVPGKRLEVVVAHGERFDRRERNTSTSRKMVVAAPEKLI
jgi:hypothetical protein